MKRILAIILAVLMCMTSVAMIASCNKKGDETPTQENTTPAQTEAPTEAPTTEPATTETVTDEPIVEDLTAAEEAMAYIHQLYKDSLTDTGNYELIKSVKIGDKAFTIEWTITGTDQVTIESKNDTVWLVLVPKAEETFQYTLTATITDGEEVVTRSYTHTVPKFEVAGFDSYIAAATGESVVVQGIITSISSKSTGASYNNLYLQDLNGNGGYYIYEIADAKDPLTDLGLKVGMTVSVSGVKEIYNGTHEVKKAVVEIIDATEKPIEFIDITSIALTAENAKDGKLTNFQGCWVTLTGVEITGVNEAQYYYKWIIGNVDTYTRLALSSGLESSVLDEIKAGHVAHTGYTATVKGIVNVYSGAFYLIPLGADAFVYGAMAEVADDVKVDREKAALSVNATYTTTSKLELPVAGSIYNTVTIAWTTENTDVLTIAADGKVTFLKAGTATLKATITSGTASEEVTFTVTVEEPKDPAADSTLTIEQASSVAASKPHNTYTEGKYYVIGTIKEVATGVYGNMTIVDADGNELYVYGTWNEDGTKKYGEMDNAPVVGDTIKLYGILGSYNGKAQMKNGWIMSDGAELPPSTEGGKPVAGTEYVGVMVQTAAGKTVYLSGGMNGYYMATSENAADAIVLFVEETEGGLYLYTMVDGVKTYINMVVSGTHVNGAYEATPSTVYTYDETAKTLVATVNDTLYAFGTRNDKTYTTIGPVKVEMDPFLMVFSTKGGSTTPDGPGTGGDPVIPEPPVTPTMEAVKPVVGTAYKIAMIQTKAGKTVFIKGGMSGYYMATSETFEEGLDFYVEETTGGYFVYTTIEGVKTYIDMAVSGTYVNAVYTTSTPTTVLTYNETLKTLVGTVNGAEYVFGTRNDNTYTTIGCNKVSYDPFYAIFVAASGSTTPENPGEGGGTVEPNPPTPPVVEDEFDAKYVFADMEKGATQYAPDDRVLDDNTKIYTVDCHITTELRIYKSAAGSNATSSWDARNGVAIIESVRALSSITLNIGNKKTTFTVSASVDGVTYVEITKIEITNTEFTDYTVDLGDAGYRFVKLETTSQGRVAYIGLNFAPVKLYEAATPVVGTKYNFVMFQANAEKLVYVNGEMNGYYMNTVANVNTAVNFYVEETEGGYYLYTVLNGYKVYLNMVVSGTHVNGKYEPAPSTVYTYDETLKTLVATVNGTLYVFGTRNDKTYTTIGPVKAEQTPFIAQFVVSNNADEVANEPASNVIITLDQAHAVISNMPTYGATSYNTFGVKGIVVEITEDTITIKSASGTTLVIKGVYDATGEVALKDMETKPGVGDTIAVLGKLTNIGGACMVNGWLAQSVAHTCDMTPATCATPATCKLCGKTEGEVKAEHDGLVVATCAKPEYCTVCGYEGTEVATAHNALVAATCAKAEYCELCGYEGTAVAAEHNALVAATCVAPEYCTLCGYEGTEVDADAHGEITKETCILPQTCKLCGEQFGEVSGEHLNVVDCECTACGAIAHTGELSTPTCMEPAVCSDCGEYYGEVDAENHVGFSEATCTRPATCECGVTKGTVDPDAHGNINDACECQYCGDALHEYYGCECANGCGIPNHEYNYFDGAVCIHCDEAVDPRYLTVKEADKLGASKAHNTYTTEKYIVTCIVTSVYNTQYGNMNVKDLDGNTFVVYGLYSANGKTRYDAMSVKPKVGDIIVVYGIIGQYSNTAQMKNGWLLDHKVHTECDFAPATCAAPATCKYCAKTQGTATDDHNLNEDCFCSVCGESFHNFADGVCTECGAEEIAAGYVKVTSAEDFTSGTYIIVTTTGVGLGKFSGGWITVSNPTMENGVPVEGTGSQWTLTISGSSVTMKDASGQFVKPKTGNNNGIQTGSYNWAWAMDANGYVTFKGTGSDTTILASNKGSSNQFRAYKNATVSGNTAGYPSQFVVYKWVG